MAAEKIYAFLLTDRPGVRANVKLVRLYSPGTARTESPALKYVPASSNLIFGFDVGSLSRDPRIMSLVAKFETAESVKFASVFGRERWIDAIDRALFAFQVDTAQIDAEAYQPPGTFILNMRTSVDPGKLLEAEEDAFTRVQHRGKVYYQGEDLSLYFPNDRTILGADLPDEQFVSIVESGGSRPSLPPQTMAAVRALPPADVWFVMPYKTVREKLEAALHEDENFAGFAPAQNVVERLREVETVAGWAKLEGDQLRLTVSLACTGTSGAERLAEAQRIFFDLAKSLVEAQEKAGGDAPTPLGRELIETFRIHTEGTRVLLSTEWNVDSFLAEAVPNAQ